MAKDGAGTTGSETVLLVEDNEANQTLALRQLEVLGCVARAVRNGREAIDAVAEAPYALILMDCEMPEMDGFEATREIRRREETGGARIPIIAMTAYATEHDREACIAAGMDDYISKPVMVEDLKTVLARWGPGRGGREGGPAMPPPSAVVSGPGAAIDPAVLRRLRDEIGADGLSRFLGSYLAELPGREMAIRRAVEEGAPAALRTAAHTLKSASGALGATALARICEEMEGLGRSGTTAGADERLGSLEAECRRVTETLERERRGPEA